MKTKKYGWNGWKMPVFNLNDPDYCEYGCPICTRARQGKPIAQFFQKIEILVTFGGCWWGRARRRKYGVEPNEAIPEKMQDNQA